MIELGSWSLCRTFSLFEDTVSFSDDSEFREIYDIAARIPAGTYPFNTLFTLKNQSSQESFFQFKDANDVLYADIVIEAGKTGVISFPPMKSIKVLHKGGAGKITLTAFLGSLEPG